MVENENKIRKGGNDKRGKIEYGDNAGGCFGLRKRAHCRIVHLIYLAVTGEHVA